MSVMRYLSTKRRAAARLIPPDLIGCDNHPAQHSHPAGMIPYFSPGQMGTLAMTTALHEGTEEWARAIKERVGEHLLALHDILCADLFINRLVEGWDTLDPVVKAALFRSGITIYARPFIKNNRRSDKKYRFNVSMLKGVPDFDRQLHDHICTLRNTLIAHHDTAVVNMLIGHMRIEPEGRPPLALQTYGTTKALHAIAKKEIAERYLKHITACKEHFLSATNDALRQLHMMRVAYPDLAVPTMTTVPIALETLGDRKFRLPNIESIARFKPINTPNSFLSQDSYIWLELTYLFEATNLTYTTEHGVPVIEVIDEQVSRRQSE
jgi:hypothetical protein